MQFVFLLIFFVIQTNILPKIFTGIRPEMLLIFLALAVSTKGMTRGMSWGFILGLLLDLFAGLSFFYVVIYSVLGFLMSIVPGDFFKNFRVLVVNNIFFGTLFMQLLVIIFSNVFLKTSISISFLNLLYLMFLNSLLAFFITNSLASYFGVTVED